jgi:hypothetical protein
MGFDAQHRTLVKSLYAARHPENPFVTFEGTRSWLPRSPIDQKLMEEMMGRGILLWLLGVPIPVIILLWLFFGR